MNILESDAVYKILDFLERKDFFNLRRVSKGVKSKVDKILLKYVNPIINKRNGLLKWAGATLEDIPGIQEKNNIVLVQIGLRELDKEKSNILKSMSYFNRRKKIEEPRLKVSTWKKRKFHKIMRHLRYLVIRGNNKFGNEGESGEFNTVYYQIEKRFKSYQKKEEICKGNLKVYNNSLSQKRKRLDEIEEQKAKTLQGLRSFSRKIKRRKRIK